MKTTIIHIVIIILICFKSNSQNFKSQIIKLNQYDVDSIDLEQLSKIEKLYILNQKKLIEKVKVDETVFEHIKIETLKNYKDSVLNYLLLGDYYLHKEISLDSVAFVNYSKSLNISLRHNDTLLITEACEKIFNKLHKTQHALKGYTIYLDLYKRFIYNIDKEAIYLYHKYNYQGSENRINQIDSLKIILKKIKLSKNRFLKGKISQLIGTEYNFFEKKIDSSLKYNLLAKSYLTNSKLKLFKNELFGIYGNIGLIYQNKKQIKKANEYFLRADSIKLPRYRYAEKQKLNKLLSDNESLKNNWEKALFYLSKSNEYSDTLKEYEKAIKITEINTKLKTTEKEKENLILQKEKKQTQNIALTLGGSLALGSIIAFLLFKNTKRKQKLAEQQKEIETQKLATVLKEQELTSIDAMIKGQEKERQRIANELHDDLGGLMATIKLHFSAIKEDNSPELFSKTNILIDDAYHKIRSVAHAKNSGVIAKHGLLKSVQEMANKISISNKLKVEVIDYGLETRLENSLELTIFRIIQELVSNAVKHADASEINIHITNHDESLNIMVEDNGKGFNQKQITKTQSGMGISTIDKRTEHLNGKMIIESEKGEGTTVIIDIPL